MKKAEPKEPRMRKRTVTISGDRPLIFYTFAEPVVRKPARRAGKGK